MSLREEERDEGEWKKHSRSGEVSQIVVEKVGLCINPGLETFNTAP